jgi:hypothetical protein
MAHRASGGNLERLVHPVGAEQIVEERFEHRPGGLLVAQFGLHRLHVAERPDPPIDPDERIKVVAQLLQQVTAWAGDADAEAVVGLKTG